MLLGLVLFIAGMVLVIKGADWLVDGASSLARRLGISELAIGLTIVAFGTSMPELTVNLFSSFNGASDIAIGNVVGSNIANILLIIGVSAIIAPLAIQNSTVWKELPLAFLAAILVCVMSNDAIIDHYPLSEISRSDGIAFIGFFAIFLWYIASMKGIDYGERETSKPLPRTFGMLIAGLVGLVIGGKLVVDGATAVALGLGVSQALIGLTIVAVGTSVPELATSVVAARKNKADIAIGNIVGSNIFNIFWVLGLSAVIRPLPFESSFNIDILVMIGATLLFFFAVHTGRLRQRVFFWRQKEGHIVERREGIVLLACYIVYIAYLVVRG